MEDDVERALQAMENDPAEELLGGLS
jgi:hypothetical protein